MKTPRKIVMAVVTALTMATVLRGEVGSGGRRIAEGTLTPEFSAVDTTGQPFTYERSSGKVLVLAFLSPQHERSHRAVEDILTVVSSVPADKIHSLQVALVFEHVDNPAFIASVQEKTLSVVPILVDKEYTIWGKFGVIATPTLLIADAQGRVCCVKSGQAYDMAPVVKSRLYQALGIPYDIRPEDASTVRIVSNAGISDKARRHLNMARMLLEKGRVSSAVEQAQLAYEMDPKSPDVALELGELLCRAGQAQKAITLVSTVSVQSHRDKARINLALGWANRQMGKLDEAEAFLQEGINQDPTAPRLYFELGRVYQQRNDSEKAMQTYFRALQLVYGEEQR